MEWNIWHTVIVIDLITMAVIVWAINLSRGRMWCAKRLEGKYVLCSKGKMDDELYNKFLNQYPVGVAPVARVEKSYWASEIQIWIKDHTPGSKQGYGLPTGSVSMYSYFSFDKKDVRKI